MACVSEGLSAEELKMISAGTRPRTLHHGSPGGKRHRKRKPLNNLPSKGKKGPLSIKQTWSVRAHMGFPEHVDKYHPKMNWTELGSSQAYGLPDPKCLQSEKHYSSLNLAESNEALAIKKRKHEYMQVLNKTKTCRHYVLLAARAKAVYCDWTGWHPDEGWLPFSHIHFEL